MERVSFDETGYRVLLLLLFECERAAMLCYHAALLAWLRTYLRNVLLSNQRLVPPDHRVNQRRLDADHPRDVDEGAQAEWQIGLEEFVL